VPLGGNEAAMTLPGRRTQGGCLSLLMVSQGNRRYGSRD